MPVAPQLRANSAKPGFTSDVCHRGNWPASCSVLILSSDALSRSAARTADEVDDGLGLVEPTTVGRSGRRRSVLGAAVPATSTQAPRHGGPT